MSHRPDENQVLAQAVQRIWQELPRLFGSNWQEIEKMLDALLTQLGAAQGMTLQEQQSLRNQIRRLFFRQIRAAVQLQQAEQQVRHETSPMRSIPKDILQSTIKGQVESTASITAPRTVTRYVDVHCPRQWSLGQGRGSVSLRLTMRPNPESDTDEETSMDLLPDQPVTVFCHAPGFTIEGSNSVTLTPPAVGDSGWATFVLTPKEIGETTIEFHLYQGSNAVEARVSVEILAKPVQTQPAQPRNSYPLFFEPGLAPPDFTLWISVDYSESKARLRHTLFNQHEQAELTCAPLPWENISRHYMDQLYVRMTGFAENSGRNRDDTDLSEEIIKAEGRLLWEDILPGALKRWLEENWGGLAGRTLLLLSDEPDIPWELIWPNLQLPQEHDRPLAAHFRLGRWLRPEAQMADSFWLTGRLSWRRWMRLMNREALDHVVEEDEFLQELVTRLGADDLCPVHLTSPEVIALLQEQAFSWIHVATHGSLPSNGLGDQAKIHLGGRKCIGGLEVPWSLFPTDFVPIEVKRKIAETRPGIFFNTCNSARQHQGLTGSSSWARRLINAGAGLYLSSLWAVTDASAVAFSRSFYSEMARSDRSTTVGEAIHTARQHIHIRDASDPTWLAYTLFGHPNARVAL